MKRVAALYVQADGAYAGINGVELWDEARDARRYAGPWPVVAHPPCQRWTRMHGFVEHVYPGRFKLGDDAGCFAAALASVRRWGGVLEHPEGSQAWEHFGLLEPPRGGGWIRTDALYGFDGWACCVDQGAFGHRARKRTWLYACGVDLPSLHWGSANGDFPWVSFLEHNTPEGRRRAIRTGVCQRLSKRQRSATPPAFRDLLLSIARTAQPRALAA
jgi:hypothetical protein